MTSQTTTDHSATTSRIPIIDYPKTTTTFTTPDEDELLIKACQLGFAYYRLPPYVDQKLLDLERDQLTAFFRQDRSYQEQWPLNKEWRGYCDRRLEEKPQQCQSLYQDPYQPLPPFRESPTQKIAGYFENIALDLLYKTLSICGLRDRWGETLAGFSRSSDGSKQERHGLMKTFSAIYYDPEPLPDHPPPTCGLTAHDDFGLITVLRIHSPGLMVFTGDYDPKQCSFQTDDWLPVNPIPGTVVINWGQALSIMTGQACHSAIHAVPQVTTEPRLSYGLFVDPHPKSSLVDFTTDKVIWPCYSDYLQHRFDQVYKA